MARSEETDGVRKYRIADKKGYVIVASVVTMLFGGPLLDVVITTNYRHDRDEYHKRIEDLEKTVYLMEHGLMNTDLMCTSNMRLVSTKEDEDE